MHALRHAVRRPSLSVRAHARAAAAPVRGLRTSAPRGGSRVLVGTAAVSGAAVGVALLALEQQKRADAAAAAVGRTAFFDVEDLPWGEESPVVVPMFVEVAKGSRMKYEYDHSNGLLRLDRVLHSATFYPHNYGFISQTLCGDGDALDVLVMCDGVLQPGSIVDVRPIAYLVMEDEKGLDEKVLAVLADDPRFKEVNRMGDVSDHVLREIGAFFSTYKSLEKGKWAKCGGWRGTEDTHELILDTHRTYLAKKADEAERARR